MPGKSKKGGGLEVGSAYKMKGWSGYQSPSPIQQPKKGLAESLANIQKNISGAIEGVGTNIRKHVKPQSESSGFGLTSLEKKQAKKSGMSEWQWKTERSKSGTSANRYARENKLGKYAKTTSEVLKMPKEKDEITGLYNPEHITHEEIRLGHHDQPELVEEYSKIQGDFYHGIKPIWDPSRGGPEQPVRKGVQYHHLGKVYNSLSEAETAQKEAGGKDAITPTIDGEKVKKGAIDYTPTEGDWITRKGDPWSYKKNPDGSYTTKKGEGGKEINVKKGDKSYGTISSVFEKRSPKRKYKKRTKK